MARIAVFSDAHMGVYGDGIDPETGLNARLVDTSRTVSSIVAEAVGRGVDAIAFGGDMGKTKKPSPTELDLWAQALKPARAAGVPVYFLLGNHDAGRSQSERHAPTPLSYLDGVELICRPEHRLVSDKFDDVGADIIFLPYPNKHLLLAKEEYKDLDAEGVNRKMQIILTSKLHSMAALVPPGLPSVLVAHMSLSMAETGTEGSYMLGRDLVMDVSDIPDNIVWCLFGHVHKPQAIPRAGRKMGDGIPTDYAYVIGSPEIVDFSEEGETKRWLIIDTSERTIESIPSPCRPYRTHEVSIHSEDFLFDSWMDGIRPLSGEVSRVRLHLRRGASVDSVALKRKLLDAGASSVKVEKVYYDDSRSTLDEERDLTAMSHGELVREYCRTKGFDIDRTETVVRGALSAIQEVSTN